ALDHDARRHCPRLWLVILVFIRLTPRPPASTLFPYTTLFRSDDLAAMVLHHPLRDLGYDFDVPLLDGEHVTDDAGTGFVHTAPRSEEHTSELQSRENLVCRLLLEKKKKANAIAYFQSH